jgi:hypothetical protein
MTVRDAGTDAVVLDRDPGPWGFDLTSISLVAGSVYDTLVFETGHYYYLGFKMAYIDLTLQDGARAYPYYPTAVDLGIYTVLT